MFRDMVMLVVLALVFDLVMGVVGIRGPWLQEVAELWATPALVLLGVLLVAWPIWHRLAPRPFLGLRAIGWVAAWIGVCMITVGRPDLVLEPFGLVALVLYVEIARALLDRQGHRSEPIPEMRVRRSP